MSRHLLRRSSRRRVGDRDQAHPTLAAARWTYPALRRWTSRNGPLVLWQPRVD